MAAQWIPLNQKSNIQKPRQQTCPSCPMPLLYTGAASNPYIRGYNEKTNINSIFSPKALHCASFYDTRLFINRLLESWHCVENGVRTLRCMKPVRAGQLLVEKPMRRYEFTFVNFEEQNKCAPPDVCCSLAFSFVRLGVIFKSCLSHHSVLCNAQLRKNASLKTTPASMLCSVCNIRHFHQGTGTMDLLNGKASMK